VCHGHYVTGHFSDKIFYASSTLVGQSTSVRGVSLTPIKNSVQKLQPIRRHDSKVVCISTSMENQTLRAFCAMKCVFFRLKMLEELPD